MRRQSQNRSTSPSLEARDNSAHVRRLRGRSSDSQAAYSPSLPSSIEPVLIGWVSFLLTAAGQFRIHTGFPFNSR